MTSPHLHRYAQQTSLHLHKICTSDIILTSTSWTLSSANYCHCQWSVFLTTDLRMQRAQHLRQGPDAGSAVPQGPDAESTVSQTGSRCRGCSVSGSRCRGCSVSDRVQMQRVQCLRQGPDARPQCLRLRVTHTPEAQESHQPFHEAVEVVERCSIAGWPRTLSLQLFLLLLFIFTCHFRQAVACHVCPGAIHLHTNQGLVAICPMGAVHKYRYTGTYTSVCIHQYIYTNTYTNMYVHQYIYCDRYTNTYTPTCIHQDIYTNTYTLLYTYI